MFKGFGFNGLGKKKEAPVDRIEAEKREMLAKHRDLAKESHEQWRAPRKQPDGTYTPRYKPLKPETDQEWMKRNKNLVVEDEAVTGGKGPYTDIAKLSFDELPDFRKADTLASSETAIEALFRAVRNNIPLDEGFADSVADTIHEQWLVRNGNDIEKETKGKMEELGYKTKEEAMENEELADRMNQLEPYARLTEKNKKLDRDFVLDVIKEYKETHPQV